MLSACHKPHTVKEIESALRKYDQLIQKMDADSISLMYTTDGNLGNIAFGRDSIRHFLSAFKNVRVLYVSSQAITTSLKSDSATQTGTYRQVALLNGKDTARLKGEFTALWLWSSREGWRIKSMMTTPAD